MGQADLVLFTKWDRFSRNAADAYHMFNVLGRFGIEAQAIEQPLGLDIACGYKNFWNIIRNPVTNLHSSHKSPK